MSTDFSATGRSRPVRVEIYLLDADGEPDRFLCFGTLIDAGVVVLHPRRQALAAVRAGNRVRVVLSETRRPLFDSPVGRGRVVEVIDGSVCAALPGGPQVPVVASLDLASTVTTTPLPFPIQSEQEPSSETSARLAAALTDFVADVSAVDPVRPPRRALPRQQLGGIGGPVVPPPVGPAPRPASSGGKPFWCWICHGAIGC